MISVFKVKKIPKSRYKAMLNVIPPILQAGFTFGFSEFLTHNPTTITLAFTKIGDCYYEMKAPIDKRKEWDYHFQKFHQQQEAKK